MGAYQVSSIPGPVDQTVHPLHNEDVQFAMQTTITELIYYWYFTRPSAPLRTARSLCD